MYEYLIVFECKNFNKEDINYISTSISDVKHNGTIQYSHYAPNKYTYKFFCELDTAKLLEYSSIVASYKQKIKVTVTNLTEFRILEYSFNSILDDYIDDKLYDTDIIELCHHKNNLEVNKDKIVDEILDKINVSGIESLTEDEVNFLNKYC